MEGVRRECGEVALPRRQPLISQIKITVIGPEAGLSCVKESVI